MAKLTAGRPPCTRTPLLSRKALQGWGQLGVTLCHPDILPWEMGTAPSREGVAMGGMQPGCVGRMEKNLPRRGQRLSEGLQHPGKGLKGIVIDTLEIPSRRREEVPGHLPWHDRTPASPAQDRPYPWSEPWECGQGWPHPGSCRGGRGWQAQQPAACWGKQKPFAALIYYLDGNQGGKNNIPECLSPCNPRGPWCPSLPVGTWGCQYQHTGAQAELCPHPLPTAGRERQQEKCPGTARGL